MLAAGSVFRRIHPCPILVFGNQKSGTTAITALLGELTQRPVTLDLAKEVRRPTFHKVHSGAMTIEAFVRRNRRDFARDIVKEPNLVVLFDQLLGYFPQSRLVFLVRDPRDNVRSILNRLQLPGDIDQLQDSYRGVNADVWNLYLDGSWLGIEAETVVDVIAARWNLAADVYLANASRMVLCSYELFLQDKVGAIERLADQLGLDKRRDIADKVDVQWQPRGDRDVSWTRFFSQQNLARVEQRCRSRMVEFGYRPNC
ncbi:MAG: hypothetical protein A2W31_00075 [Planctomycetes bacterium RBG_16_64_10]|nr:MAG: hypothetical protein A2W31_00075 [Planctomycetes bacterium RBG_16_64_10]